jgi:hypothetical protein
MFVLLDFIGPLFEMNQYDSRQYRFHEYAIVMKTIKCVGKFKFIPFQSKQHSDTILKD